MTTVVVTKTQIAADRKIMVSKDDATRYYVDGPKITRSRCNRFAYAFTGMDRSEVSEDEETYLLTLLRQMRDSEPSKHVLGICADIFKKDMLILTRHNFYHVYDGYPYAGSDTIPWLTIGSGSTYATMAMLKGYKPKDAVAFAGKFDHLTGTNIDVIVATTLKDL